MTLAVVDDVGAVVVIALFYTSELYPVHILIASGYVAGLGLANRLGLKHPLAYGIVGVAGM